ncbi:MAG: hypothetical protein BAJALOKI2v1_30039 [Promethearchaeota archaeon]|nr:MAG: hypothetical protein BAJALOKI2v1_30039 [Candidatus Lokiarchaeota archaeon]
MKKSNYLINIVGGRVESNATKRIYLQEDCGFWRWWGRKNNTTKSIFNWAF